MKLVCSKGCATDVPASSREMHRCEDHDLVMVLPSQVKPRKQLKRSAPKKRSRGISPASKAQRAKVRDLACLVCGRDRHEVTIDPAHLWPRGKGGCDSPDCVGPLCREDHRAFEENKIDLLEVLVAAGYWTELAHPTLCHEVSPTVLVNELSGHRYRFVETNELEAAAVASGGSTA